MSNYRPLTPAIVEGLSWTRLSDYRHTRHLHLIPVAAPEISRMAAELPLVFARRAEGGIALQALLGLEVGVNHCLGQNFRWQLRYTPALLRVDPFRMLAPRGGKSTDRTLCVDLNSPWVTDFGTEAFFEPHEVGEPPMLSAALKEVMQFLVDLEKHFYRTQRAVEMLQSHGLLTSWDVVDADGNMLPDVYRIDEAAFQKMPDKVFLELRRAGAVAIAYTQMISTQQLPGLRDRAQVSAPRSDIDMDSIFGAEDDTLSFNF